MNAQRNTLRMALLGAFLRRAGRVAAIIALAVVSSGESMAASLAPFTIVMIDGRTEAAYGSLPFNRGVLAAAIDRLTEAKAKGIVIKFFYDLPSTEVDDHALEQSLCRSVVALQASLNDAEGTTNALESKFQVDGVSAEDIPAPFVGDKALLPLPRFRRCAKAVGFVDTTASEFPLFEAHQGKVVKSLQLIALEMASSQKAEIDASGLVKLGTARLEPMHAIDFPRLDTNSFISLHEVMRDTSKGWQAKVRGSVVILGYDGKNIHSIETARGPMGAHRFFITTLLSLRRTFETDVRNR